MKFTLAMTAALLGAVTAAPSGCSTSFSGSFEITVTNAQTKRDLIPQRRDSCGGTGTLVLTLSNGQLTDAQGRTGYIASNYQFQFDNPVQENAISSGGYSVCAGNVLALNSNMTFSECLSGDFYNLYDRSWAAQCSPATIVAIPCGGSNAASQNTDGQVVGTTIVQTTIVTALSDGQPQVKTTTMPVPLCQITDGQVQVKTTPCASITSSAKATSTYAPVSQYSDGQIQVTPLASTPAGASPSATPMTVTTPAPIIGVSTSSAAAAGSSAPAAASSQPAAVSSAAANSTMSSATLATSTKPASSSAAAASSSAATSAPATGGSSSNAVGSIGALVVGLVVAFACL